VITKTVSAATAATAAAAAAITIEIHKLTL